jgi:hypothetical protein
MARGKATYRKRDLRVAREVAHEGDVVEARPDGTIVIITGNRTASKVANGEALTPDDELERWRGRKNRAG